MGQEFHAIILILTVTFAVPLAVAEQTAEPFLELEFETPAAPARQPVKGDFIERLVKLAPNQSTRLGKGQDSRVYEIPMGGQSQEIGPCGSKHIRRKRSPGFMRTTSACMFTAMAQEWKEKFCPNDSPDCQLLYGDMSYGDRQPKSWPHSTHHDGQCVDVWPVRKPGKAGELNIHNKDYDSARTKKLVELMVKWGAENRPPGSTKKTQLFFNDPVILKDQSLGVRSLVNHDNHIHVCFRSSPENYKRCKEFKLNTKLCPTLKRPGE